MKITKDNYIKATAEAMNRESTQKLLKADSQVFDMFSLFAFAVFNRLDGKDITEDSFYSTVADVIAQASPEKISSISTIKQLALIIFSLQIWEELEKLDKSDGNNPDKPDGNNPEYDSFKTELNSKL